MADPVQGERHTITADWAPNLVPTSMGQHWTDRHSRRGWLSVGIASLADWKEIGNSGDVIGEGPVRVDRILNVAAFATYTPTQPNAVVETLGYYDLGDGGHATYYIDENDRETFSDGGSVFAIADGRRAKLRHTREADLRQFGARDGQDCTAQIQAALNWLGQQGGGVLYSSAATFLYSSKISLPDVAGKIAIVGQRRAASLWRYTGTQSPSIESVGSSDEAGSYLFKDITFDGEGNANVYTVLSITNFSARELLFENFGIHDHINATGLVIDQTHSIGLHNVKINFCKRAGKFGENNYFNAINLSELSIEDCSDPDYVLLIKNGDGVFFSDCRIQGNASGVLLQNCKKVGISQSYFELNCLVNGVATGKPYIEYDVVNNFYLSDCEFFGSGHNCNALRMGRGKCLVIGNDFNNFQDWTFEVGGAASGIGPLYPVQMHNTFTGCNQSTGYANKWTGTLEAGHLTEFIAGTQRFWDLGGASVYEFDTAQMLFLGLPAEFRVVPSIIKFLFDTVSGTFLGLRASPDANGTAYLLQKARGSLAAPTIIQNGDVVGDLRFRGYDGANYIDGALIRAQLNAVPGANDMPCKLQIYTRADGQPNTDLAVEIDGSVTANDTRLLLFDVNSSTLKRILVGPPDSAGAGFRSLRLAN